MSATTSIKLDAMRAGTAHHIVTGAFTFPYAVDAHHAVANHPEEWSALPWTQERAAKARASRKARHEAAKRAGAEVIPPLLPEPVALDPEDQTAIDEHSKAQAEAAERLAKFEQSEEERRKLEEQVQADRALLASPPPAPVKRPFGRKGEPTAKEREMLAKRGAGTDVPGPVDTI